MFKRKIKSLFGVMSGAVLLCVSAVLGVQVSLNAYTADDLNSELVSVFVKDTQTEYVYGTNPSVQVITDEVFPFKITVKNTGIAGWHGSSSVNDTSGAALISYNNDSLDKTFGTFFVLLSQGKSVAVGQEHTFDALLKAPAETGNYTMRWRQADWPNNVAYAMPDKDKINFFGDEIIVNVQVGARTGQVPKVNGANGVLEINDFTYEGTFKLPATKNSPAYSDSGLTLRTVAGEKRLIYYDGNQSSGIIGLNEIAVPETFGKIVNGAETDVAAAELRTTFTHPFETEGYWNVGDIWYDQKTGLFYWTNFNTYDQSGTVPKRPILYWGKFNGSELVKEGEWTYPGSLEGPYKSYWRGVTGVPESLSDSDSAKFKGRRLVLGFGGTFSGNAAASYGPALGTVSVDNNDFMPVMYYAGGSAANTDNWAVRDGNYFDLYNKNNIPASPWEGKWTSKDTVNSGVFIDLPDKKGYLTFVKQSKGRSAYDYGGTTWLGEYQNSWYFYDFETLKSEQKTGLVPSSYSVVEIPVDSKITTTVTVTGSCFDPDTRLLYLMTKSVFSGAYENQPAVHVYRVTEDK